MTVTAEISTKDRYELLSQTLLSIALQTVKPQDIIIFDDGDNPRDLRELPAYQSVFHLFNYYGIGWQVVYGRKLGQHVNHQWAQELSSSELLWRIDDDEVAEPDVLEKLIGNIKDDVGAVAGLVLPPAPSPVPKDAANIISDLNRPNVQWFNKHKATRIAVEHLHSTFLYKRGIAQYELSLSPAAHREETLLTHSIFRKGFKLIVDTDAVTWHFRAATGGIRSHQDASFWEHDERIFQSKLLEWGVNCEPTKIIVLDCGRGDHVIVKSLLPRLKAKYGKVLLSTCFPDIFEGEPQISIAEAHQRFGNLERFSVYRWCIDHNWTGNLVTAHEKLYGLE